MNIRQLLVFIRILVFVCCSKDPNDCTDSKEAYIGNIKNIIESSCNNGDCHTGLIDGWAVLPDFSTYKNLVTYLDNGLIESRINSEDDNLIMPPLFIEGRNISDSDLASLNAWICNGYPEE